ncbi:MAG TPA: transglycosylase domain-containing protein, partial [Ktedonobacterales bacterium]|nr:transglycosylase domain-containing protein [Ktedonobacterales bacterium]
MSRDSRNYGGDYDERDLDGRAGPPRGRRPNGGGGGRGPSDPSMRRPSSNGNSMMRPPYGSRGSGPRNGGPRSRDYDDDGGYSEYREQPSRRSRAEYRDGPPSRAGGRSRAGDSYEMESSRAPRRQRRGFGEMVGDMSRQLSAMVRGTGRAMQREAAQIAAAGSRRSAPITPSPEMLAQIQSDLPRYRRSRIRMRARKWRLGRVRANPVGYAIGVAAVVVSAVSILGGGGAGAAYAYNYYDVHRPAIQSIINNAVSGQNTVIYDRNGKPLYTVRSDSGYNYYVPLSQIGQTIQDATLDTEDHSFYSPTNIGVDFQGTLRAVIADVTHGGAADQGGSTITQQLVKRLILHDPSKQIQRKLNEMILAVGLNANYSKSQILEMYLNTIDYGDQNQGIEAAARNFFGLEQKNENGKVILANQQLSIAQAAILAGLPNNPTYYLPIAYSCDIDTVPCEDTEWAKPCLNDPHDGICDPNPDYVDNWGQLGHEWIVWRRARVVLQSMNTYGSITDSQYLDALNQVHNILVNHEIKHWAGVANGSSLDTTKLAPSFVDYITRTVLPQEFGIDPDSLPTAGWRIYTTLDYNLEEYTENNIDYYINKKHTVPTCTYGACHNPTNPPLAESANAHDGAVVAVDPYTGDVLAMAGSAKYGDSNPLVGGYNNVAVL